MHSAYISIQKERRDWREGERQRQTDRQRETETENEGPNASRITIMEAGWSVIRRVSLVCLLYAKGRGY